MAKSDLRERIAFALLDSPSLSAFDRYELAESVIRELGLRSERGTLKVVRYVSNWEFDSDE